MYADTLDKDLRTGSVEILKLQFSQITTIHGVGPLTTEFLHIEMMGTHADLFIGVETNADISMRDLFVVTQIAHGLHDLGDTRLVIGSQQGSAIGDDQVFSDMLQEFWELACRTDDARTQLDVLAVIVTDNPGLHVLTAAVGGCIVMTDKSYGGNILLHV